MDKKYILIIIFLIMIVSACSYFAYNLFQPHSIVKAEINASHINSSDNYTSTFTTPISNKTETKNKTDEKEYEDNSFYTYPTDDIDEDDNDNYDYYINDRDTYDETGDEQADYDDYDYNDYYDDYYNI